MIAQALPPGGIETGPPVKPQGYTATSQYWRALAAEKEGTKVGGGGGSKKKWKNEVRLNKALGEIGWVPTVGRTRGLQLKE